MIGSLPGDVVRMMVSEVTLSCGRIREPVVNVLVNGMIS